MVFFFNDRNLYSYKFHNYHKIMVSNINLRDGIAQEWNTTGIKIIVNAHVIKECFCTKEVEVL